MNFSELSDEQKRAGGGSENSFCHYFKISSIK
jgi:hypothetical protein